MPIVTSSGRQSVETIHWVGWADQDYIAARILLLTGLIVQGSALASTAVEKYLKGVCKLAGIPCHVGHNVSKLNGLLHNRAIRLQLNSTFLKLLDKAYKLRYPDELAPGFNVALNSISILVELDVTVDKIRRRFAFIENGKVVTTRFDHAVMNHSPELLAKNCVLGDASKEKLFSEPSWSYELRVFPNGGIMEVSYVVEKLPDEDNFQRNAFTPISGSEGKSFNLAWLPKQGTAS